MKMHFFNLAILILALFQSSCATYPKESESPAVNDDVPLSNETERALPENARSFNITECPQGILEIIPTREAIGLNQEMTITVRTYSNVAIEPDVQTMIESNAGRFVESVTGTTDRNGEWLVKWRSPSSSSSISSSQDYIFTVNAFDIEKKSCQAKLAIKAL